MIVRFAAVFLLASALFISKSHAHGAVSFQKGQCMMRIGPDVMNFTGYQPDSSTQEFCDDIPQTGRTLIVLDTVERELRDMLIEFRVIRDIGPQNEEKANLNEITEAYIPGKKYVGGTVNFQHVFKESGKFVGLVTATDEHHQQWVARFPFSVGRTATRDMAIYTASGVAVVALLGAYAGFGLKRRVVPKKLQGDQFWKH